ncbi:MAG: MotA/TolQ/ExbB proton channel family protein [Planctomycetota bacterium]
MAAATPTPVPTVTETELGLWDLFSESFDVFTVVLVLGSFAAVALMVRVVTEARASKLAPEETAEGMSKLAKDADLKGLRKAAESDPSPLGSIVIAALDAGDDESKRQEAAELAAADRIAGAFRLVDPLAVIGNLAPLIGLAGTVWGMIIAFATLGETGGQAGPGALSSGISKALFHTLLGLVLAAPSLAFYGFYRAKIDKLCNRVLVLGARIVEQLPAEK